MTERVIQIGSVSYFPEKIMGKGATGTVYQGNYFYKIGFINSNGFPVAVKCIKLNQIQTPLKKHLLDCQVLGLSTIKGKYICQTFEIVKDEQYYYIPMQICPGGALRDYIKAKVSLTQKQSFKLFGKILQGYSSIYSYGFVHRDLKTDNILLRENLDPVIIDFGYCQKTQTQGKPVTYNVGSPAYMSAQAYNDNIFSQKSDIWALGIIFHQMLTGRIPIMRTNDIDQHFRRLKTMKTAQIIKVQSNQTNSYLQNLLTVDVNKRYGIKQAIQGFNNLIKQAQRKKSTSSIDFNYTPQKAQNNQHIMQQKNMCNTNPRPKTQHRSSLNLTTHQHKQIMQKMNVTQKSTFYKNHNNVKQQNINKTISHHQSQNTSHIINNNIISNPSNPQFHLKKIIHKQSLNFNHNPQQQISQFMTIPPMNKKNSLQQVQNIHERPKSHSIHNNMTNNQINQNIQINQINQNNQIYNQNQLNQINKFKKRLSTPNVDLNQLNQFMQMKQQNENFTQSIHNFKPQIRKTNSHNYNHN